MEKSFFEYLGLADVERIHSQFLAWVLSDDCNAIDTAERQRLLKSLFNVRGKVEEVQTERNRIDILIKTSTDIIVIENKIKSSQHSNQLTNYKLLCNKEFPEHSKHFFFLTLIDEVTSDNDWQQLSYSTIFKHLSSLELSANNTHSSIIQEYLVFLKRLDNVIKHFKENIIEYDMVFFDGKKKKQDKKRDDYKTENEWFIASNQLETILQKSFLNDLVQQVNSDGKVNETRGNALVDFPLQGSIEFEGRKYATGIQLQGKTIKFKFAIQSEIYTTSKKAWIEKIVSLMGKLSKENKFNYKKLNKPKGLAYVSISKKIDGYYWHKPLNDLTKFIQKEIENGKELTTSLINLLKT